MTELTLQQQSDYLAEHLLGWRSGSFNCTPAWITPTDDLGSYRQLWHPPSDIIQCFEYIVPAMRELGYDFYLKQWKISTNGVEDWVRSVDFEQQLDRTGAYAKGETFSEAIVRAAYLAVKAMKEKE